MKKIYSFSLILLFTVAIALFFCPDSTVKAASCSWADPNTGQSGPPVNCGALNCDYSGCGAGASWPSCIECVDSGGGVGLTCPGTPCPAGAVCIENPLCAGSITDLIDAITNFIFWIGMAVAPIMLIIAGFIFVTASGSPERVKNAKNMILYTLIGLAVVLFAKGLILVLKSILGVTTP